MRTFWRTLLKPVYLPLTDKLEDIYAAFSPSGRALFLCFSGMLIVSSVFLTYTMNERLLSAVPGYGGTLTEGIIGSPRFINPVLAISDADRDLTNLIYSGLLRATEEGKYANSLAESYTVSEDDLVYTFVLQKGALFHDGTPVTASDVVFTISKIQDPALKSPLRASWDGVVAEELNTRTVRFTLKSRYTPFIENLTVGILPKALWQNVSNEEFPFSELNTAPIGSGPFKVDSITRTPSGIPNTYDLVPFSKYTGGRAYLSHFELKLFSSEAALLTALNAGQIEAASGITPALLPQIQDEKREIVRAPLNRVFGVYYNQNQSEVLRDVQVRTALGMAIHRSDLISQVLGGYATPIDGPVPPGVFGDRAPAEGTTTAAERAATAREYLLARGWKAGEDNILTKTTGTGKTASTKKLQFSLATGNVPELRASAEYLRVAWQAMGSDVDVKIFEQGDLSQNVIRPRKYDALLFGQVVGREIDLYAFWHSSQRNDPGLNVALYANATVDRALDELRSTSGEPERRALYETLRAELVRDIPALFLYTPDFVYSVPKDIMGLEMGFIETPSDRFLDVASWHRETDFVWPLFVKNK